MSDPWGALLDEGGRVTLYAVRSGQISAHDCASADEAAQLSGIAPERLIVLDAAKRSAPPAEVLAVRAGYLGALQQAGPAALLAPGARVLIAGALASEPDWDGIIILPDTDVTLWAHVSAREIVSFQGAMTGQLAAALGATGADFGAQSLGDTMSRPERLAAHLYAAALNGDGAAVMGHLLGAELATMRAYWLGQQVRIIGAGAPYVDALASQGLTSRAVPRAQAWQAGLLALGLAAELAG